MRLSLQALVLLLVPLLLFGHTVVGFSLLPTRSFTTRTKLTATVDKNSVQTSTSTSTDRVLTLLEKRLKKGPGALSKEEVALIQAESQQVLGELELKKTLKELSSEDFTDDDSFDLIEQLVSKVVSGDDDDTDDSSKRGPDYDALLTAVAELDASTISSLQTKGVEMDEATTEAAFWAVVNAVDQAEAQDQPLSANIPQMLHHIFDADLRHLLTREHQRTNVTCMQPKEVGLAGGSRAMNYIFDDSSHKDLPLTEGRRCEGGSCCDACSRNVFPTFASEQEIDFDTTFPGLNSLTFNDLATTSAATILQFTRLIERVRRTMAHEYGLPLKTILPLQAYSRKYVAGTTQKGGGGGEGDMVTLHTDESTHDGYHYSCVIYLSTHGKDFEGGAFVFNDPAKTNKTEAELKAEAEEEDIQPADIVLDLEGFDEPLLSLDEVDSDGQTVNTRIDVKDLAEFSEEEDDEEALMTLADEIRRAGRELTPYYPTAGSAVIFSSGWENMHEVEKITSGVRYAVPAFFTTCPVPQGHYDLMVQGKPQSDEDIADDWLHLLLAHRKETPMESTGRVKELLMKWHHMCTPLSEH